MDIFNKLKADHKEVKEIMSQIEKTEDHEIEKRADLFAKFCRAFLAHGMAEEEIFYGELDKSKDKDHEVHEQILEAIEEHNVAKYLIQELEELEFDDEKWAAKFKVLKENIEHHVEEEESEMFDMAHKKLPKDQTKTMGQSMEMRENEYKMAM